MLDSLQLWNNKEVVNNIYAEGHTNAVLFREGQQISKKQPQKAGVNIRKELED